MRFLKHTSRTLSAFGALALAAAALGAAPAAQKREAPAPGKRAERAPPPATRTYESLVAPKGARRAALPVRPVVAVGEGGRLLAVSGDRVWASANSGRSWSPRGALATAGGAVALRSSGALGWRWLGRDGRVAASEDDGRTWTVAVDLAAASGLEGERAVAGGELGSDGGGWAVVRGAGGRGPASRLVVGSGGAWRPTATVPGAVDAAWAGGGRVVAIAGSDVYRAAVGAEAFERIAALQGATLNAVAFADTDHGWIAAAEGLVIETNDGGATWLPRPVAGSLALEAIGAWTSEVGWAIGSDGARDALFATRDGGVTWRRVFEAPSPLSEPVAGGGAVWLLDGRGALWSAPALGGPWRAAGALDPSAKRQNRER